MVFPKLDRGTWNRSVRAENATIARLWLERLFALGAHIEKLASICGHSLFAAIPTEWTSDGRIKLERRCIHRSDHTRRLIDVGFWPTVLGYAYNTEGRHDDR